MRFLQYLEEKTFLDYDKKSRRRMKKAFKKKKEKEKRNYVFHRDTNGRKKRKPRTDESVLDTLPPDIQKKGKKDLKELKKNTKPVKRVKKDGEEFYKCPWDSILTPVEKELPQKTDPNWFCNLALKLDCGHWMFDDCESGLNGMVHKNKKIL